MCLFREKGLEQTLSPRYYSIKGTFSKFFVAFFPFLMDYRELLINDFSKSKRYLPYFEQKEGTDAKPTLYGVHLSKKGQVQFTFRFSNGCYLMTI